MAEEEKDKGKIIPAGAPLPPEKDTERKKTEAPKTTVKVGDREYSSLEDLAKDHENLQGLYGKHTEEVSDVRAANKVLTMQAEATAKEAREREATKEPPTDYEGQLTAIYKQLNDGDISVEEAMQQSNALTAEAAAAKATEASSAKLEETLQNRDAEAMQKQFLKDNPDFVTLRDSGALEPIKQGPGGEMHDDFSAYYALKAAEGVKQGKKEAAELAAGDKGTQTVLTKPGETIQQTNKPKTSLSETELETSMLGAALNKGAGEGGG